MNSVQQDPFWDADRHSSSQKSPCFLLNPIADFHKNLALSISWAMLHGFLRLNINFNIILMSSLFSSKFPVSWSKFYAFFFAPQKRPTCFAHLIFLGFTDNIWRTVRIVTLFTTSHPAVSQFFLSFRTKRSVWKFCSLRHNALFLRQHQATRRTKYVLRYICLGFWATTLVQINSLKSSLSWYKAYSLVFKEVCLFKDAVVSSG